jgi:hypothetical protein
MASANSGTVQWWSEGAVRHWGRRRPLPAEDEEHRFDVKFLAESFKKYSKESQSCQEREIGFNSGSFVALLLFPSSCCCRNAKIEKLPKVRQTPQFIMKHFTHRLGITRCPFLTDGILGIALKIRTKEEKRVIRIYRD